MTFFCVSRQQTQIDNISLTNQIDPGIGFFVETQQCRQIFGHCPSGPGYSRS